MSQSSFRLRRICGAALAWLLAIAPAMAQVLSDPVSVPVQFQGLFNTYAGNASVSITPNGTHIASKSGASHGDGQGTTNAISYFRPGKNYVFTITTSQIKRLWVKITPPAGYRVFINGVE